MEALAMMAAQSKAEAIELTWRSYKRIEWDMETPLAVVGQPVILYTFEEVSSYCHATESCGVLPRFVLCERIPAPYISPRDTLSDWLDLSAPIPENVQAAFDALNAAMGHPSIGAWVPSFTAVTLPEAFLGHLEATGNRVSTF